MWKLKIYYHTSLNLDLHISSDHGLTEANYHDNDAGKKDTIHEWNQSKTVTSWITSQAWMVAWRTSELARVIVRVLQEGRGPEGQRGSLGRTQPGLKVLHLHF